MSELIVPVPGREELGPLGGLASQAAAYVENAQAANTTRAYAADWRDFSGFCSRHGAPPLPASPATLALYLTDLASRVRVSTLTRRLSAIAQAHHLAGHESPTESTAIRKLVRGIRRTHGTAVSPKRPLLVPDLLTILEKLPPGRIGIRDRALLLIGFSAALRRSELVALDWGDLAETREGLVVTVRRSKTDQEGEGRKVAIPRGREEITCPVATLRGWQAETGATAGAVFLHVDRHGRLLGRMSDQAVALVVKRRAGAIGLAGKEFAGHSLRAGLATSAALAGKSERSIMSQTGHRSVQMVRRYIRDGNLFRENAAEGLGL
jgi:integrase